MRRLKNAVGAEVTVAVILKYRGVIVVRNNKEFNFVEQNIY